MHFTIAFSKIKKRNLVLINNATYQRETLSERPIRQPLTCLTTSYFSVLYQIQIYSLIILLMVKYIFMIYTKGSKKTKWRNINHKPSSLLITSNACIIKISPTYIYWISAQGFIKLGKKKWFRSQIRVTDNTWYLVV